MDLHDEHGMPGTAALAADAVQQPAAQRRTLLLVDDEPNILASLKRLLRRDAYHILTANSGQEGLDVLASHAVDVIVSDQRMPGMLGADFLRKAKLLCPQTIRIMLSGYTELQAVTDAVNEGAIFKFLTKPWEDHQLREHIAEAFRLKGIDDDNVRLNAQLRDANQALAAANAAMQALVSQQQHQISRDEVSLGIAREVLQFLPLAVIGLDDEGMIAFINASAANLFERGAALLGNEAALVLPQLFDGQDTPRLVAINGQPYVVAVHPMGLHSRSRGSLVTLSRHGADT
ncbi:response regulator [Janthinobacterium tructae]